MTTTTTMRIAAACTVAILAAAGPALAAPCLDFDADGEHSLTADGTTLSYCITELSSENECHQVDLATGTRGPLKVVTSPATPDTPGAPPYDPEAPVASPGELTVNRGGLKLCDAKGACRTWKRPAKLAVGIIGAGAYLIDEARDLLVVGQVGKRNKLELGAWTLSTGKAIAARKHSVGREELIAVTDVRLLDDALLVTTTSCAGPCTVSAIYALKTLRQVAPVGGKGHQYGSEGLSPVRVSPNLFAFGDDSGAGVVLQDVRTGKVKRRIKVKAPIEFSGTLLSRPQADLVYVGNGGYVAVVDPWTGKVRTLSAPRCPE